MGIFYNNNGLSLQTSISHKRFPHATQSIRLSCHGPPQPAHLRTGGAALAGLLALTFFLYLLCDFADYLLIACTDSADVEGVVMAIDCCFVDSTVRPCFSKSSSVMFWSLNPLSCTSCNVHRCMTCDFISRFLS